MSESLPIRIVTTSTSKAKVQKRPGKRPRCRCCVGPCAGRVTARAIKCLMQILRTQYIDGCKYIPVPGSFGKMLAQCRGMCGPGPRPLSVGTPSLANRSVRLETVCSQQHNKGLGGQLLTSHSGASSTAPESISSMSIAMPHLSRVARRLSIARPANACSASRRIRVAATTVDREQAGGAIGACWPAYAAQSRWIASARRV